MVDVSMEREEGELLEGSTSSGLVHDSLPRCAHKFRALLREAPESKIDAVATCCKDRTKASTPHEVVYDFLGSNDWRSGSFPRNQKPESSKKNKKKHANIENRKKASGHEGSMDLLQETQRRREQPAESEKKKPGNLRSKKSSK